jgi:peptidoglycan-N-acetylglucosamine deacetylase
LPNKITLTFDNGPEPAVTPLVLDCLARHDIRATFFVLGRKAATPSGAEMVRRCRQQGHHVGNHTWSHTERLGQLSREAALQEFDRCAEVLDGLGVEERLFRPLGGGGVLGHHLLHPAVVERLQQGGYTCVLWSSVPRDFRDPHGWTERALSDIRSQHWSLMALHDLPNGAMTYLDDFLLRVKAEGHQFSSEYPPDCLPIVDGRVVLPLEPYLTQNLA